MKKIILVMFLLLLVSGCQTYNRLYENNPEPVIAEMIQSTSVQVQESVLVESQEDITTEARTDFTIESNPNNPAEFYVFVNLTDGTMFNLGKFGFEFKSVVTFYGQHEENYYNLVGYILPSNWNIEMITGLKQMTLDNQVIYYDQLQQDPIFIRGRDYPLDLPFGEIELQVNRIRHFSDNNQTDFFAFVRVRESQEEFNIISIILIRS